MKVYIDSTCGDLKTVPFPNKNAWPKRWHEGQNTCLKNERHYNPTIGFEHGFVPDSEMKSWLRQGLAHSPSASECPPHKGQRYANVSCFVMGFDTCGEPTWLSYSGPWVAVSGDEDIQALKDEFMK